VTTNEPGAVKDNNMPVKHYPTAQFWHDPA
jgi:hypothetical protein